MHSQLNYMIAQQRSAELQHAGACARLPRAVRARRTDTLAQGAVLHVFNELGPFVTAGCRWR